MPENVPYAREVLNAPPTTPTPATDYFIRQPDGRIEHWISDLAAPHTLRPVSFNVAVTGAPPPKDVTRSGGAAGVTLSNVSYVEQTVRPTVNIPLTALVLENATAAGAGPVALAVLDVATATWLGAGTAAVSGSGLQAPLNDTLLAGREYRIRAGNLGSGVNGTTYDGYLASVTLGSGYSWTGLATTGGVAYWDGTYKTVADAAQQLPLQYATGDMAGFDPSGMTIRGTDPVQVTYDAPSRTYTVALTAIDLDATGTGEVSELLPTVQAQMTGDGEQYLGSITANEAGEVTALSLYASNNAHPALTVTLSVRVPGAGYGAGTGALVTQSPAVPLGGLTWVQFPLAAPLRFTPGQRLEVYYADNDPDLGVGAELGRHTSTGPVPTTDGRYTLVFTDQNPSPMAMRLHGPAGVLRGELPLGRVQNLQATLDAKASSADLAALTARVTAVEARPTWDAEAIQDLVGAMLPQGTYDDAGGTVSFTFATPRTNEEIQDVVAALIQAGANVTKTYDDAGNVLTLSATGGSSGPTTRTASGTTPTLAAGASANLDLVNATPALIRKLVTSAAARVGLYASAADRTADAARLDGSPTAAPTSAYPITQATTTAAGTVAIGEAAQGALYARVVNLSGAAAALTLTLTLEDA